MLLEVKDNVHERMSGLTRAWRENEEKKSAAPPPSISRLPAMRAGYTFGDELKSLPESLSRHFAVIVSFDRDRVRMADRGFMNTLDIQTLHVESTRWTERQGSQLP